MIIKLITNLDEAVEERVHVLLEKKYSKCESCEFEPEGKRADVLIIMINFDDCSAQAAEALIEEARTAVRELKVDKIVFAGFRSPLSDDSVHCYANEAVEGLGLCTLSDIIILPMPQLFAPGMKYSLFDDLEQLDNFSILSLIYIDDAVHEIARGIDGYANNMTASSLYAYVQLKYKTSVYELKKKIESLCSFLDRNMLPRLVSEFDRKILITLVSYKGIRISEVLDDKPYLDSEIYGSVSVLKLKPNSSMVIKSDYCLKYLFIINNKVQATMEGKSDVLCENQKLILPAGKSVEFENSNEDTVYIMTWKLD